jgi:hypothetical protein
MHGLYEDKMKTYVRKIEDSKKDLAAKVLEVKSATTEVDNALNEYPTDVVHSTVLYLV